MRMSRWAATLIGLVALLVALLGAAALARADEPPDAGEPMVERWSADPRLWLALIEWRQRLRLDLESSRELCTAGTLTEISWKISGGTPPYSLRVEGSPVDVEAESVRINCGALTETEAADEAAALAAKTITAAVTDARGVSREAVIDVARARALPAPTNVRHHAVVGEVIVEWDEVAGAGSQSPVDVSNRRRVTGVVRTRANHDGAAWTYDTVTRLYADDWVLGPTSGVEVLSVAAVRHPLEVQTPNALNWSDDLEYASTTLAQNVTLAATHDTVTVSWNRQPHVGNQQVRVWLFEVGGGDGWRQRMLAEEPGVSGRHTVTFTHLPPNSALQVWIEMHNADYVERSLPTPFTLHDVRTQPPPAGWASPPVGPQNLRHTQTDDGITILWDAPYPDAEQRWYLTIENPATGALWGRWLYSTSWTWTTNLASRPDTQYRITVEHADVPRGSASILITTLAATPVGGQAAAQLAPPFEWWADGKPNMPALYLKLESSRELCTAGTLTEISWTINGGVPPYSLSVDGSAVDASAENVRINCGALSEAEAADGEADLAAKTVTATVTDARGVRHEAALDVARARALPAPSQHTGAQPLNTGVMILTLFDEWQPDLDGDGRILMRHRPVGSAGEWSYVQTGWTTRIGLELTADQHTTQMAYLRHPLEAETPEALNWNRPETHGKLKPPPNLQATATHDTVTVSFDDQPGMWEATIHLVLRNSAGELLGSVQKSFSSVFTPRPASGVGRQVVFEHVPPDSLFSVRVSLGTAYLSSTGATATGRTAPAPSGWTAPLQGPQNLRATATHNSITVQWDPPYEDPDIYYFLAISEAETGREIDAFFPGADQREWTIQGGLYERLRPNTRYRIEVTHEGLPATSAAIVVSTLPFPSMQGTQGQR